MWLLDILQYFLNAETHVCGFDNDLCWDCVPHFGNCPGTAFTAVAAAFATQGYWVQADLLDMLTFSNMAALGPLIYVASALGGLIGVAINQPPRIYMWFFLGPAIYGWLIDARQEVNGVQWQVGMRQLDQREVWKLSEVGLINTNLAKRLEDWGYSSEISLNDNPAPVYAANFFVWYDSLLSGVVNGLIDWAGPYALNRSTVASEGTNIGGGEDFVDDLEAFRNDRWFLLSNLKWTMMQDVTNAKVVSASLRDAFATFIGGLCGESLYNAVDEQAFISASHGRPDNIPTSIFRGGVEAPTPGLANSMSAVLPLLATPSEGVAVPEGLRSLFKDQGNQFSFYEALGGNYFETGSVFSKLAGNEIPVELDTITCDHYLFLLILAFRWEAAQIYNQMILKSPEVSQVSDGMIDTQEKKFLYNFFYGWNLKNGRTPLDFGSTVRNDPYTGQRLDFEQTRHFLVNLILVHLIRNEFAIVKQPVDVRRLGTELAVSYSEGQMRTVGSISRFGEIYSWAILMPYLQGVLMYFLAIAYPFACLAMLVPGMHKSLFTWMSFWAWVKIWDVGFALVMALERSVWAMVGNSSKAAGMHDKIVEMNSWAGFYFPDVCSANSGCAMRMVQFSDTAGVSPNFMSAIDTSTDGMVNQLNVFDRALALGPSLDLDLANSYYIYIMAALYLAVPAVTGQLVLGAKAGMASMLTQAVGQNAQEAGRAAGSAYTGDVTQRLKSNASSIGQASYAAYMQKSNLASNAIEAANMQTSASMKASELGAWKESLSYRPEALGQTAQQVGQQGQRAKQLYNMMSSYAGVGMTAGMFGPWGQTLSYKVDSKTVPTQIGAAEASKQVIPDKAKYNALGFEQSALASGYGRGAGLQAQQAQFGAEMARWSAVNQMANQLGGISASVGVMAGALDPGPKPMSMDGMAMHGMLGASAKKEAETFNPFTGSFLGGIAAARNGLAAQAPDLSQPEFQAPKWTDGDPGTSRDPSMGDSAKFWGVPSGESVSNAAKSPVESIGDFIKKEGGEVAAYMEKSGFNLGSADGKGGGLANDLLKATERAPDNSPKE